MFVHRSETISLKPLFEKNLLRGTGISLFPASGH
jgi:hypothetical protein